MLMVLLSTLILVANIFLFVPFDVYLGNTVEFEAGFGQMLANGWRIPLLTWFLLMVPAIVNSRLVRTYAAIIFVLACFTWLQSSLLIWNYGVFDGRGLDFQSYHFFGVLDLLILVALLVIAVFFTARITPLIIIVSSIFLIGQLVIIVNGSNGSTELWKRDLPDTSIPTGFSIASRENNIFHIILDSAQSDIFLELVEEADLRPIFDGFTQFFDNAACTPYRVRCSHDVLR